jgi:hypothetical protein
MRRFILFTYRYCFETAVWLRVLIFRVTIASVCHVASPQYL